MAKIFFGSTEMSPAINTTKYIPEERFGANLDTFIGKVDENGTLLAPQPINEIIDFTGVKKIDREGLHYAFSHNTKFSKVLFPDLEQIDNAGIKYAFQTTSISGDVIFPKVTTLGSGACDSAFAYSYLITSISFPVLVHADANYSASSICYHCSHLSSISFPLLETVGLGAFSNAFYYTSLVEASFPNLTTIGEHGFFGAFGNCQNLTTVLFPKLKSIGISGLQAAFSGCKSLVSISFPELIEVQPNSFFATYNKAFNGCPALTEIHFRADMQSAIEALDGYSEKFGATNATVYFDL